MLPVALLNPSLLATILQGSSAYLNAQNAFLQTQMRIASMESASAIREHQLKMFYLQQEFQKADRIEEFHRRLDATKKQQVSEYMLRAHQDKLSRVGEPFYIPGTWVATRQPNKPAPFIIFSLNPKQENNPFRNEAARIAPLSRVAKRLRERNLLYEHDLFSIITTQESFSSETDVYDFFHRELNCPSIIVYGEFTGAGFSVNALYAGLHENQVKFRNNEPIDLGPRIANLWEISYKNLFGIKQTAEKAGDKYGWLETLEMYTETFVGLYVQSLIDSYFSYSPEKIYPFQVPNFLLQKEEELKALGMYESLHKSLTTYFQGLKRQQALLHHKPVEEISQQAVQHQHKFVPINTDSLVKLVNGKWGFTDKQNNLVKPILFLQKPSRGLKKALKNLTGEKETLSVSSGAVYHINEQGKHGFLDKNGELIVPYEYDDSCPMRENYAAVKKEGKWGMVNNKGDQIIPFSYELMNSPSNGKIICHKGEEKFNCGLIDLMENVCLPFTFSSLDNTDFDQYIAAKYDSQHTLLYGLIDSKGRLLLEFSYDWIKYLDEGFYICSSLSKKKISVFNSISGKKIALAEELTWDTKAEDGILVLRRSGMYDEKSHFFYNQDLSPAHKPLHSSEPVFNLDKFVSELSLTSPKPFSEGYAVAMRIGAPSNWGAINEKGETIVPFVFKDVTPYCEGRCFALFSGGENVVDQENQWWGMIDERGYILIE